MIELSVVIPTFSRVGLLLWCLEEYKNQSLAKDKFEIVVVNDGGAEIPQEDYPYNIKFVSQENKGPAAARNLGVKNASGKTVLFVGDDCLPHRHLLYRHWISHRQKGFPCSIQGYTDWHPSIPPDDFHRFLHGKTKLGGGGLQANWNALKDKQGNWISSDVPLDGGFFLTTNISVDKETFLFYGGFPEVLKEACWEDISLGITLLSFGIRTYLCNDAANFHYHRQALDGFVKRQIKEGRWRPQLCALHPFLAPQLLDVEGMRRAEGESLTMYVEAARVLHYNRDDMVQVQEARQNRWALALRLASLEGIKQGLQERGEKCHIWWAIQHLHLNDAIMQTVSCAAAYEKEDLEFATVCYEWANKQEPDAWCMPAIRGEILLKQGKRADALAAFRESLSKSAGEKWPLERVKELSE